MPTFNPISNIEAIVGNPGGAVKGAAKQVAGIGQYTSGLAPLIQAVKHFAGGKSSGTPAAGAPNGGGLEAYLSQFGQYLPQGMDIKGALAYNDWKTKNPQEAAMMESLGIKPNFQAQQQASGYNPLQLQTLFSNVLAPQLAQTSQQEQGIADQYSKAMQGILGGNLPANMKATLQSQVPGEVARMKESAVNQQEMGMMGPYMDALMSQMQKTQTEEAKRYYEDIALKAAGITNTTGLGTAGPFSG